jgi:hypothetical protein
MTGSTRWSPEVPTGLPKAVIGRPVPLLPFGVIDSAVLGFVVNLYLRMIRAQMALVAGLRFSGLDY